jgi:hypothetical protein
MPIRVSDLVSERVEWKGIARMALWGTLRLLDGALGMPARDIRSAYVLMYVIVQSTGGDLDASGVATG